MKVLFCASLLAVASAFTSPSVFRKPTVVVQRGEEDPVSHRTRQATIVNDGKANGKYLPHTTVLTSYARTRDYEGTMV